MGAAVLGDCGACLYLCLPVTMSASVIKTSLVHFYGNEYNIMKEAP